MAVNANGFNSRLTSEALEQKFRNVFPAQAGAELIQDLYASGVIVPIVDFTDSALGSQLPSYLQQAWDFSTGNSRVEGGTATIVTTPGFWQVELNVGMNNTPGAVSISAELAITDGITSKKIWKVSEQTTAGGLLAFQSGKFTVFVRSGDSITIGSSSSGCVAEATYRQVADLYGNLTNPSGFQPQ